MTSGHIDPELADRRRADRADQLVALSAVRRDEIGSEDAVTAQTRARIQGQNKVVESAARSLETRIAALEKYARSVEYVDRLLAEQTLVEQLNERETKILELVADSVRDGLAIQDVERLTGDAPGASETLAAGLEAVHAAAHGFLTG